MPYQDATRLHAAEIQADVAIVGAGAAGIALALEFANHSARVVLLESGDFSHRHRTQFLYLGENIGRNNISTAFSRFRRFGGSTTRWGGQCRPLDPIDFEARPGMPLSGWPFDYFHLEPYYRRAQRVCNLGRYDYDDAQNWRAAEGGPLPLDSDLLQTRVYQFSHPTDFGAVYRAQLETADNIDVYLNANLVEILSEHGAAQVTGLRLATLAGRTFEVRAKHYVLACGGIENARLLLVSNGARSSGFGNEHDLVGRYFMDHAYTFPGYYEPAKAQFNRSFYVIEGYEQTGNNQKMVAAFSLSERVLREEGLNGCSVYLLRRPRYKTTAAYSSAGGRGLNHLIEILQHCELPDGRLQQSLKQIVGDFGNVCRSARDRIKGVLIRDKVLALRVALETTPCRESRVTLGPRKDRFGMPRVRVDWRINETDKRGYERLLQIMRNEFARLGLGRLVEHEQHDEDGWPSSVIGGKHHMGTTRMAANLRDGVVDPECQVHGIDNLHIAGSSVFPTGGYANPTLTIVALAIRLADRLKARLADPSA
jgi:choline dehydrogenase-like flavoprotein